MTISDTSAEAQALQLAIHRRLGPDGRLRVALSLSQITRQLFEAGIRQRHPDYSEVQVKQEVIRALYGSTIPA